MTPRANSPPAEQLVPAHSRLRGTPRGSLFWGGMASFGCLYLILIVAMVIADLQYAGLRDMCQALRDPNVRYALNLSLISCTIAAILATWVAVPSGYLLARSGGQALERHFGERPSVLRLASIVRHGVETLFDIPIVLPPLVVGISLLVLFETGPGQWLDLRFAGLMRWLGFPGIRGISYELPAVVLAQFTVATAFSVRIMRATFEQMDPEPERMALSMGATESQAFSYIALPQAWPGMVAAFTMAWARSLGEFGPILVFAGTTRMKTEVLSTTVYLNFSIGNLRGAVAASLLMLSLAGVILVVTRSVSLWADNRVSRAAEGR